MSLLHPPAGFPPVLVPFWPLLWVQILALRAYVRATYGKGTLYRWSVTPYGVVYIISIVWVPGQTDGPAYLEYAARAQARISAALDGRAFTPDYARDPLICAHSGESRDPTFARVVMAALDPGFRRGERLSWNVPLPET